MTDRAGSLFSRLKWLGIGLGQARRAFALLAAVAVAAFATAIPAGAQLLERWPGHWILLATQDIQPGSELVVIDLTGTTTAIKALRLHTKGAGLEIDRLTITYADRAVFERAKPLKIAANSRTWPIDFRRGHKFIDAVTLTLKPQAVQGTATRLEVWGLQDSHGAKIRRAPAKPAATAEAPPPPPASGGSPPPAAAPHEPQPTAPPATRGVDAKSAAPAARDDTRVGGAAPPDWQIVQVFFGTDRAVDAAATKRLNYSAERARRLELGRALVTVPRVHAVPQIERPWVLRVPYFQYTIYEQAEDPAKHFTIREISRLTPEEMLRLVAERLAASSAFKDHVVVFVHGFNTSFDNALYRTAQLAYDLKFDGVPFAYSWPSKGAFGVQDYNYDRESAGQAEPHLKSFLELVAAQSGARHVSIIAHSMGSQVLLPVLRDLKRSMPQGVALHQVILAAPDVDRDNFEFLAREIEGVSRGMTLYAASNDRAMEASRRFAGGVPRAGDVPSSGPIVVPGIDTIDVTATSTAMLALNHAGFAEKSALLNDLQLLIQTGERPPDRRVPILEKVPTDRGAYWRYPGPR